MLTDHGPEGDIEFLSFPLRLNQSGLLKRQQQAASVVGLLQVMARTPAGSWQGCPSFGLRDLFEGGNARVDVIRVATTRINDVFRDLGIEGFEVTDMIREPRRGRDGDTYAITLSNTFGAETLTTTVSYQE